MKLKSKFELIAKFAPAQIKDYLERRLAREVLREDPDQELIDRLRDCLRWARIDAACWVDFLRRSGRPAWSIAYLESLGRGALPLDPLPSDLGLDHRIIDLEIENRGDPICSSAD